MNQNKFKDNLLDKIKKNKIWFCPRLFDHLYVESDNSYKVCCIGADSGYSFLNTTPAEWLNSELLNDIRREVLQEGNSLEKTKTQCFRCMKQEEQYGYSDRLKHIERILEDRSVVLFDKISRQIEEFTKTGTFEVKERTLLVQPRIFGNQCNLDCYMCQPSQSSTRLNMYKKFNLKENSIFEEPNVDFLNIKNDTAIETLLKLAPYIDKFLIQGGEPLVMKKQYKFLDALIESGESKNIVLDMSSNLTILGDQTNNILDYIPQFKRLCLNVSVDGYGVYNDYIRRRSSWEDITKNLELIGSYNNVIVDVFSTISLLSILKFDLLEDWTDEMKKTYRHIKHTKFIVDDPDELHIKHLPPKLKEQLLIKFSDNDQICKALNMEGNSESFNKAMFYIKQIDKHYGTDVFDLFPELGEDQN